MTNLSLQANSKILGVHRFSYSNHVVGYDLVFGACVLMHVTLVPHHSLLKLELVYCKGVTELR